jgi:tRNA threonylcarbamoyladenosine biosynthesis protein TsaE
MQEIITKNEQETLNFALIFAKNLKGGEIITLSGELGAGKTLFTKGLALGLGVKKVVNSPTFVIMKIYPCSLKKIKQLVHIDAYRLESENDIINIGAVEYFGKKDTIVVIEWPEKIKNALPKKVKPILIEISEDKRRIIY